MNSYKKIIALAVIAIGIFAFSNATKKTENLTLNLTDINVYEIISKQQLECRPSSDYMFFVETNLVNKVRGASTVNAKVFILEKSSGKTNILVSENLEINKFNGFAEEDVNDGSALLRNGDRIINDLKKKNYDFKELIKFETIYNGYIKSTNKLLDIQRAI